MADGVDLVPGTWPLQPTTTYELRFSDAVVPPDLVGKQASPSPLVLRPPLAGTFVWLSQRSGVFTPTEPVKLDTEYHFTLQPGLRGANGEPLRARLDAFLRTPAFGVVESSPSGGNADAPLMPTYRLVFNADINAYLAGKHMLFQSPQGGGVPARASYEQTFASVPAPAVPMFPSAASGTWQDAVTPPPAPVYLERGLPALPPIASPTQPAILSNTLHVVPERPLPVGNDWKLVVRAGLKSADGQYRMSYPFEVGVGNVRPFVVTNAETHNSIRAGKRVALTFSKRIPPVTEYSNHLDWITFVPPATNLSVTTSWNTLWIAGSFDLATTQELVVSAGFPAAEPIALAEPFKAVLKFDPVPPRLYFSEFETDQLSVGCREFPLLSVNVPYVDLRAKLVEKNSLIHALRGYQSYFKRYGEDWSSMEPYREIPVNIVPGRTVYTNRIMLSNSLDIPIETRLKWDDILHGRTAGVVFISAESSTAAGFKTRRIGTEALVQLTDLGLAWKRSPTDTVAYLFSHTSGRGVGGAVLRMLDEEDGVLAEQTTDASGLARLPMPVGAAWLMAEIGDDMRAVELTDHRIRLYSLDIYPEWRDNEETADVRALTFTDRSVYRSADTVQIKAIVREWGRDGWKVPAGGNVVVECYNGRDQLFLRTNAILSKMGSLALPLTLPQYGLGRYRADLTVGGKQFMASFLVQEYRPNAFDLKVDAAPQFAAAQPPTATVSAKYFSGQVVPRGNVEWLLSCSDEPFEADGFEGYSFCSSIWMQLPDQSSSSFTIGGELPYSDTTNCVIAFDVPVNLRAPQPRRCLLTVEFTDINQQTIDRTTSFLCHSSDFYIGIGSFGGLVCAGEKVPVDVVAVSKDGDPVPEPVKVHVVIQRVEWKTVRAGSAGQAEAYRTETEFETLTEFELTTPRWILRDDEWHLVDPEAKLPTFTVPAAGQYLVKVTTKDGNGRDVLSEVMFSASGKEAVAWDYQDDSHIELEPDKPSYEAGDIAAILVKTPINGHAWVSVERERVIRSWVTNLAGSASVLHVPIETNDAPNVFVSVLQIRGSLDCPTKPAEPDSRIGYCNLTVDRPDQKLNVNLALGAKEYRPRQPVRVTATISHSNGKPVPGAEVTLFAVDEGVLGLTEFGTPDPYTVFSARRPLEVHTGLSLSKLFAEDPSHRFFGNKGYMIGGGGRGLPRQNFVACAFWKADLFTDAAGRVEAEFAAPDNLTSYRVMAVAHTAASQFGSGESSFAINKPLMIEPALPAFANMGDRILAHASVLNRSDVALEVEVRLQLDAIAKADSTATNEAFAEPTRLVSVSPRNAVAVDFPVQLVETGLAKWVWTASAKQSSVEQSPMPTRANAVEDSVQSTMPVGYPAPMVRAIASVEIGKGETNLLGRLDPQLAETPCTVTVRLSNSRLAGLGEAVKNLLHYPYGCVEQTASSLLPWVVLRQTTIWPLAGLYPDAKPDEVIVSGVCRLLEMQTSQGGLGYWPGDNTPCFWATAYGATVLGLARKGGAHLPEANVVALANYLSANVRGVGTSSFGDSLDEVCLALYALALLEKAEPAYYEILFARRAKLSQIGRAWLALALLESKGAADLVERLLTETAPAAQNANAVFSNESSDTAVQLLAWCVFRPEAPEVGSLVNELIVRVRNGHWESTQGNAWALLALSNYWKLVERQSASVSGSLSWGDKRKLFKFDQGVTGLIEDSFTYKPENSRQVLALRLDEGTRAYAQTLVEGRARVTAQPRQNHGFALNRQYQKLDNENRLHPVDSLRVGDRVLVSLTIESPAEADYVVVDDALPAILEAVNAEFVTQRSSADALATDYLCSHREFHAGHAMFFANHLPKGRHQIRYIARVRAAGTATAPCAKVEAMYEPQRFGLTENSLLVAKPLQSKM